MKSIGIQFGHKNKILNNSKISRDSHGHTVNSITFEKSLSTDQKSDVDNSGYFGDFASAPG